MHRDRQGVRSYSKDILTSLANMMTTVFTFYVVIECKFCSHHIGQSTIKEKSEKSWRNELFFVCFVSILYALYFYVYCNI